MSASEWPRRRLIVSPSIGQLVVTPAAFEKFVEQAKTRPIFVAACGMSQRTVNINLIAGVVVDMEVNFDHGMYVATADIFPSAPGAEILDGTSDLLFSFEASGTVETINGQHVLLPKDVDLIGIRIQRK